MSADHRRRRRWRDVETAALLAKKAVLRPIDVRHPRADFGSSKAELLDRVNKLGIGPQGLGGRVTALGVNIEVFPTHIARLPVAVNLGCPFHAADVYDNLTCRSFH